MNVTRPAEAEFGEIGARLSEHFAGAVDRSELEVVARRERRQRADPGAAADLESLDRPRGATPFRDLLPDHPSEDGRVWTQEPQHVIFGADRSSERIILQGGHGGRSSISRKAPQGRGFPCRRRHDSETQAFAMRQR